MIDPVTLVLWLVIGAVAGWLAGQIMKGGSFGLLGNIIVGILGAVVAGVVLPIVGVSLASGIVGHIIHAVIGACILLFVLRLIR